MPKKKSTIANQKVRNVIVISDSHVGCSLALCHPDGASLDDGGTYLPSVFQKKIWAYWNHFWKEWVPEVTRGDPFVVVHNGDCVDGVHHNSTTQWSHNLGDQSEHAYKILKPVVEACEGRYYHIRGTEAHVGKSATEEDRLAKRLGAVPNEIGQYARYELWLRLGGPQGELCHFLHHVGTTSSSAHESSAVNAELSAMYADAGRFGTEPPRIAVRSHRHRCIEIRLPAANDYATIFVTPAWQGKSAYAWKIAGARVSTPQFGGSLIRAGDKELYTRHKVWSIEHSPEVVIE